MAEQVVRGNSVLIPSHMLAVVVELQAIVMWQVFLDSNLGRSFVVLRRALFKTGTSQSRLRLLCR